MEMILADRRGAQETKIMFGTSEFYKKILDYIFNYSLCSDCKQQIKNRKALSEIKEGRKVLACFWSVGVPDLARTSRSTRLMDMSPRVKPDINPANNTKPVTITIQIKKLGSQHLYSTAIPFFLFLISVVFDQLAI